MRRHKVTGIVLAGGKSSRRGANKALLMFRGKPLIQHAVDILRQVCENVVISADNNVYGFTGCETWPDEFPVQAPMMGIYSGMKRSTDEKTIVLSCDMPLVDPRLFKHLLSAGNDYDIVVPVHGSNCIEPLCGVYNKRVIPWFVSNINNRDYSMQHLIRTSKHKLMEISPELDFYKNNMFVNVNTEEDFILLTNYRYPPCEGAERF